MLGQDMIIKSLVSAIGITPQMVADMQTWAKGFFKSNEADHVSINQILQNQVGMLNSHTALHQKLDQLIRMQSADLNLCDVCGTELEGKEDVGYCNGSKAGSIRSA